MKEKNIIVEVDEKRYRIGRFTPAVGSFILLQIIGAGFKGQDLNVSAPPPSEPAAPAAAPEARSGGDMVRALVFAAFLRGVEFKLHEFIQRECVAVCSVMTGDLPMPISNGLGSLLPEIQEDMALVIKLEIEVLVFNLADFFAGNGLGTMMGKPVSKTAA